MAFSVAVQLALVAALFALGFLIEWRLPVEYTYEGQSTLGQMLTAGFAVGTVLYVTRNEAAFAVAGIDGSVVGVAAMLAILLGLPLVLPASGDPDGGATC